MEDIFEKEIRKETVFKDRNVLSPHYLPHELPHREREIEKVMKAIAPALNGKRPQNLFVYGKTGTGKSAVVKHVLEKLEGVKKKYEASVDSIYLNCRMINTKYQIVSKCAEQCLPNETFIGYPFSHLINKIIKYVNEKNTGLLITLDELDKIKDVDDLIYTLTRANDELENGRIAIIGITNDLTLKTKLDPRTKSTLCEEEMIFAPYNAEQLLDILNQRAKMGYKKNTVEQSALNLAAALAAQESGDARYALKLLLKAGEIADESKTYRISEQHVKKAREGVEEELVYEVIKTLPEQERLVLLSIAQLSMEGSHYARLDGTHDEKVLFSGEVYERYERVCSQLGKTSRSARWCREYLNDLDMQGLITTTISGKGVRGNTTLIRLAFPPKDVKKVIEKTIA